MSGGKETPRQKMIGMMYLVLTALLALNISKSVLNAFVTINEGLEKTTEGFEKSNEKTYNAFEASMKGDEKKTKPFYDKAMKAKTTAKEMREYVEEMKRMVIAAVEKIPKEIADTLPLKSVQNTDNYDVPAQILLGDETANNGTGSKQEKYSMADLKKQLVKMKEEYIGLFDNKNIFTPAVQKEMKEKIEENLELSDPPPGKDGNKETWEMERTLHVPVAGVMSHLSSLQASITNMEGVVINELYNSISGQDYKFDKLEAKVIAPSSYILQGDKYVADVLLVASSSTSNPKIFTGIDTTRKPYNVGSAKPLEVKGGMGKYEVSGGAEGLQKWSGVIQVDKPGRQGEFDYYPFAAEYMVAKPALVVSPTKMNVLYIGPENPLDISVPGVASENLVPVMNVTGGNGSLSGAKGKYIAVLKSGTEATIQVSAKLGGTTKSMGEYKFRVKRVPDPVAYFAGKKGDDVVSKGELIANAVVIPKLENFDFDLKFNITSFDVSAVVKGSLVTYSAKSDKITDEMKNLFKNVATGGKVFIENVRAKGPDGSERKIPGLNLKVKS